MSDPLQPESSSSSAISRIAADWIARRDRGLSATEVEALSQWLSANPAHAEEYERLNSCWKQMDALQSVPSLVRMADEIASSAKRRRKFRARWLLPLGIAATVAITVSLALLRPSPKSEAAVPPPAKIVSTSDSYIVRASSARRVDLPDGSIAELNGTSRIEVNYTDTERRITLVEGEALFTVAKNPDRPFYVTAGAVSVRAVGTAFNVMMSANAVHVLVTEGTVKLAEKGDASATDTAPSPAAPAFADQPLTAGECAVVKPDADKNPVVINTLSANEIEQVLAWKSTQLIFDRTPLDQVVEAFNRYNDQRLVLGDSDLKSRTITGVFRADNRDGFIRLLRASVDIVAENDDNGQTILRAAP